LRKVKGEVNALKDALGPIQAGLEVAALQLRFPMKEAKPLVKSVDSLSRVEQATVSVTKDKALSLSILAKEFCLPKLLRECSAFSLDIVLSVVQRVSELERQIGFIGSVQVGGRIDTQEEELESLSSRFEKLEGKLSRTEVLIEGNEPGRVTSLLLLREGSERLVGSIDPPTAEPSICLTTAGDSSVRKIEIPMKESGSLDGIISYLTKKHGGNVHEKGIVTITSKSVFLGYCPEDVGNLTSGAFFCSEALPLEQWICWDFREMRVRPTHYTLDNLWLKS
jgi:hypothetical protein